jgi:hypothetical protein
MNGLASSHASGSSDEPENSVRTLRIEGPAGPLMSAQVGHFARPAALCRPLLGRDAGFEGRKIPLGIRAMTLQQ